MSDPIRLAIAGLLTEKAARAGVDCDCVVESLEAPRADRDWDEPVALVLLELLDRLRQLRAAHDLFLQTPFTEEEEHDPCRVFGRCGTAATLSPKGGSYA